MLSLSTNGRTLNSKESLGCSRSAATAASLIQQTITTYKESNGEDRSRLVDQNAICTDDYLVKRVIGPLRTGGV